jgi:hypothetical protein
MATAPALRLRGADGGLPLGAIFAAIGIAGCLGVGLLHLDRLPINFCMFKRLTGWPCPTCGGTRTLGRLFALDVWGALTMNPLAALGALALLAWGVADLALLARGRSLAVSVSPRMASALRVGLAAAVALNWAYLIVAGR